jgi:DNA-binding NtrC family response regulator
MPVLARTEGDPREREFLFQLLQQMRQELNDLKGLTMQLIQNGGRITPEILQQNAPVIQKHFSEMQSQPPSTNGEPVVIHSPSWTDRSSEDVNAHEEVVEDSLSLQDKEIELIKKALEKHRGKRKNAARELGISERTLYRKINEYDIKG